MGKGLFLIHWNAVEAEQYTSSLESSGWIVEYEFADGARAGKRIQELQPNLILIYLSRLPSHGRATAQGVRALKATRQIPIIFVDGKDEAVIKTRQLIPEAIFTTSAELMDVLVKASNDPKLLPSLAFHPLTSERWSDLELLFGPRGACGGCWCMFWRLKYSEFELLKGEGNRAMLKDIVDSGEDPGIMAYLGDQPVGWCSMAPRLDFSALERSRILKPIDDRPVWSVVCFFIERKHRRQGLMLGLLNAAVDYARQHGARVVEGYPKDPQAGSTSPDVFVYTGLFSAFQKAGFVEVARRSPTRPVMRYVINP